MVREEQRELICGERQEGEEVMAANIALSARPQWCGQCCKIRKSVVFI